MHFDFDIDIARHSEFCVLLWVRKFLFWTKTWGQVYLVIQEQADPQFFITWKNMLRKVTPSVPGGL